MGRAAQRVGVCVAAAGICLIAACTSPPDTSKPVSVGTGGPSPSVDQAKVLAVFDGFMNTYVGAYDSPDPANAEGKLSAFGGVSGGGVDVGLQSASSGHVAATGKPSWTTPTVSLDLPHGQATATTCFDPATWHTVNARTHRPAKPPASDGDGMPRPSYPGDAPGAYVVVTTFYQDDSGNWFVFATVAHRSASC
ncbi:MAG TPA: hypothetical protein VFR11_00600 [Micromonosporaceae bacterium]|nr:hypothetical protein [Micromonosporaceae bacterium]